jgi:hypothetical protein
MKAYFNLNNACVKITSILVSGHKLSTLVIQKTKGKSKK